MWPTWRWDSPFAGPFRSFPETKVWEEEEDRDIFYLPCLGFTFSMAPAQAGQAHCGPSCLEWPSPWVLVLPPAPCHAILVVHMASWFSWSPTFSSSPIFSQLFSLLCHQIWIKYLCLKYLVISLFPIGLWLLQDHLWIAKKNSKMTLIFQASSFYLWEITQGKLFYSFRIFQNPSHEVWGR